MCPNWLPTLVIEAWYGDFMMLMESMGVGDAAEITMFDNVVVVYKFFGDLMFFVTGSQDENEIILYTVLQAFFESISLLLRCAFLAKPSPSDRFDHVPGIVVTNLCWHRMVPSVPAVDPTDPYSTIFI